VRHFKLSGNVSILVRLVSNGWLVGEAALDDAKLAHLILDRSVLIFQGAKFFRQLSFHVGEVVVTSRFLARVLAAGTSKTLNTAQFSFHLLDFALEQVLFLLQHDVVLLETEDPVFLVSISDSKSFLSGSLLSWTIVVDVGPSFCSTSDSVTDFVTSWPTIVV